MDPETAASLGAFMSGVGSVVGGLYLLRYINKRSDENCDKRIREIRRAYESGMDRGIEIEHQEKEK